VPTAFSYNPPPFFLSLLAYLGEIQMMLSRPVCCRSALALVMTMSAAGCTPEAHRYIRFPNFMSPGPAPYQRAEAIRHDPYPLNDVGPEIEGGRPREYQQPVNEVERARMASTPPIAVQPVPVPTLPPFAPPVVTGPPIITTPPQPIPPAPPASPYQVQPRSPY
jgi:hypothetical protein